MKLALLAAAALLLTAPAYAFNKPAPPTARQIANTQVCSGVFIPDSGVRGDWCVYGGGDGPSVCVETPSHDCPCKKD